MTPKRRALNLSVIFACISDLNGFNIYFPFPITDQNDTN